MIDILGYNPLINNTIYYKEKNPKKDFTPVSSVILLSKFRAPSVDELTDYIKAKFIKIVDQSQYPDENCSLEGLLANLPPELYDEISEHIFNSNRIKEIYTTNNNISPHNFYLRMEHGWVPTGCISDAIDLKYSFKEYESVFYHNRLMSLGQGINIKLRIKLNKSDDYKPTPLPIVLRTIQENFFQPFVGDDVSVDFNPQLTSEDHLLNFINTVYKVITPLKPKFFGLFRLPRKRILTNPIGEIYDSSELECSAVATNLIVKILDQNYVENQIFEKLQLVPRNRDENLPQLVPLDQIDGFLSDDEDDSNNSGNDGPTFH